MGSDFDFVDFVSWLRRQSNEIIQTANDNGWEIPKLILTRHGKTEWSELGIHTGWSDIPLTKSGEQQADEAGRKFNDCVSDEIKSRLIGLSSPLVRANETQNQFAKYIPSLNYPVSPHAMKVRLSDVDDDAVEFRKSKSDLLNKIIDEPVNKQFLDPVNNIDRRVMEHCYGLTEGITSKEVRSIPEYSTWNPSKGSKGVDIPVAMRSKDLRAVFEEGEDFADNMHSFSSFLHTFAVPLMKAGFSVDIFAHGMVLAIFQAMLNGANPKEMEYDEFKKRFFLPTSGFSIYEPSSDSTSGTKLITTVAPGK